MELDTGAGVSVISNEDAKQLWPKFKLHDTNLTLKTYSGETIKPLGLLKCKVELSEQNCFLNLYVVKNGNCRPLFGREWLHALKLDWAAIKALEVDPTARVEDL